MNSKYILFFVMLLVIGSGFVVFINSDSEVEVTTVLETTTTVPETTTTTVLETTTTTVPETTQGDEESVQIVDEAEETPDA